MEHTHTHDSVQTTARDFFTYLAFLITLVWLVVALINFAFGVVDTLIVDSLNDGYWYGNYSAGALLNSMASLIIVTPFFLFIGSRIHRDLKSNPQKKHMWVRKWLLYALLFLAFVVALTDLVILSRSFLAGEITARFIWKALTVLVVSGGVFTYFLFELRRNLKSISKVPLFSALGLGVGILLFVVWGFVLVGSPAVQREIRFDAERVSNLEQIRWQIEGEARRTGVLYETLDEYTFIRDVSIVDPVTGEEYEYTLLSEDTYELCAVFTRESPSQNRSPRVPLYPDWSHDAGRHCFEQTVDLTLKSIYKEGVPTPL
ncbi:MAG: DUF5671 domain-containing protein [Candidatus Paceibacterota bacterium]